MYIPLKIGEATTIIDPATGEPVTVIVTAAEDGQATIQVMAASDVPVTRVRESGSPARLH